MAGAGGRGRRKFEGMRTEYGLISKAIEVETAAKLATQALEVEE